MARIQTNVECRVRIDNNEIAHAISSVRLEQHIDRHHELTIRFRALDADQQDAEFANANLFASYLGKSISLNIEPFGGVVDAASALEFIGVVAEVKLENSVQEMNFATIVAKSPTISLDGARQNTFHHEMSAKDAIDALLRKHKITVGTLESTQGTMAFSVQYRETDFQYIMRLSSASGLFAFYDGQKFHMKKAGSQGSLELKWRETLGAFNLGLGTAPYNYATQGWDVEKKENLESTATGAPTGASQPSLDGDPFKASDEIYGTPGFQAAAKAADMASVDSTLNQAKTAAVGGMVVCLGESDVPAVSVGRCVKVKGMDKLDDQYWVKSVTHTVDDSGVYHNEFTASPLGMAFPAQVAPRPPITDLQSALVTDNEDPEKLGRVKVKFPWLSDDETPWLRVSTPHAGNERGWYCIPEVDDEVLVGFEHGNPDLPIVLGSLFNGKDVPHGDAVKSGNEAKMFMTKGGNMISFGDGGGSEEIKIAQGGGDNAITISMSGPSITIESEGDISIKGKTISLETTQGDFTVKSAGAVKQESSQDMQLKGGMNLKAEGSMNCDLKGGMNTKLEGGVMVTVKGSLVKIN